jgi:TolB-like protein
MNLIKYMLFVSVMYAIATISSCGVYSPYGAATSGAKTFSVSIFEATHPLVSATSALSISESLVDRVQRQSTLKLVDGESELTFSGRVVDWLVQPINVQGDETASANRVTITVDVIYTNSLDESLSFQRKFSRFVDVPSSSDIFSIEDEIASEIGELLSLDIFNASLGNW